MLILLAIAEALAEEAAPGFTLSDIWNHSGWLARGVILMLVGMMLGSLFIAVERALAFRTARLQSMDLAARIVPHLKNRDTAAALALTKEEEYKSSYLGALLRAGLGELDERMDHFGLQNAKRALDKAVGEEVSKLRRGMPVLATVGSTAPFVGLFGTTFGVINAFQGMATAGSGLASISAGISEALITTGVGIGVAIIGVWLFNYYTHRLDKVSDELVSSEADFIDWAEKILQNAAQAEAAK